MRVTSFFVLSLIIRDVGMERSTLTSPFPKCIHRFVWRAVQDKFRGTYDEKDGCDLWVKSSTILVEDFFDQIRCVFAQYLEASNFYFLLSQHNEAKTIFLFLEKLDHT